LGREVAVTFWPLLLHWVLIVAGLIYLVSRSYIFGAIRMRIGMLLQHSSWRSFVRVMIYCPACIGFWIGVGATPLWPYDGFGQPLGSGIAAMLLGSLLAEHWTSPVFEGEGEWWGDPPERDDDDAEAEEESEGSDGSD
jgi:hypothetical protein